MGSGQSGFSLSVTEASMAVHSIMGGGVFFFFLSRVPEPQPLWILCLPSLLHFGCVVGRLWLAACKLKSNGQTNAILRRR